MENNVQEQIDEMITHSSTTIHYITNDNKLYCCHLCGDTIRDINFKLVYMKKNHVVRDIETLVCSVNCPDVCEELKHRCNVCGVVVHIGERLHQDDVKCYACQ
jgi:hypothetical protein